MPLPTAVDPVKATLSTPGCSTRAAPVCPAPVTMLSTPGGSPASAASSANSERGERGGLRRLEDHGVAGGQRRRHLPGQHHHREVPRDHLPGHPERLRRHPGEGVLELVRPPGVVEEVGGGERQVDVARLLDRLAAVDASRARRTRATAPGACGRCGRGTWPARRPPSAPSRLRRRCRAAVTAWSTSAGPASATSASGSSVAGLMVSRYFRDRGARNRPSMNSPYLSAIATISAVCAEGR